MTPPPLVPTRFTFKKGEKGGEREKEEIEKRPMGRGSVQYDPRNFDSPSHNQPLDNFGQVTLSFQMREKKKEEKRQKSAKRKVNRTYKTTRHTTRHKI